MFSLDFAFFSHIFDDALWSTTMKTIFEWNIWLLGVSEKNEPSAMQTVRKSNKIIVFIHVQCSMNVFIIDENGFEIVLVLGQNNEMTSQHPNKRMNKKLYNINLKAILVTQIANK